MDRPRPVLMDMPEHVKERITELTDMQSRMTLRKSCKQFRVLVDSTELQLDNVTIWLHMSTIGIMYSAPGKSVSVNYSPEETTSKGIHVEFEDEEDEEEASKPYNHYFYKDAANDMASIFKNPKLTIKRFHLTLMRTREIAEYLKAFREVLGKMNGKIHAKELILCLEGQLNDALCFIPFFQPEFLETIKVESMKKFKDISEIAATEQWKKAKKIEVQFLLEMVPIEFFQNCVSFEIGVPEISRAMLKEVINLFSNSSTISLFRVATDKSHPPVATLLGIEGRSTGDPYKKEFKMSDSEMSFTFTIRENSIEIQRTKDIKKNRTG